MTYVEFILIAAGGYIVFVTVVFWLPVRVVRACRSFREWREWRKRKPMPPLRRRIPGKPIDGETLTDCERARYALLEASFNDKRLVADDPMEKS